jgi:ribosome-associated protein
MQTSKTTPIAIQKEPIRLSQFLKLANVVQDGVEAKIRILEGEIQVNDTLETRRGRKLYNKDRVHFGNNTFEVVKQ